MPRAIKQWRVGKNALLLSIESESEKEIDDGMRLMMDDAMQEKGVKTGHSRLDERVDEEKEHDDFESAQNEEVFFFLRTCTTCTAERSDPATMMTWNNHGTREHAGLDDPCAHLARRSREERQG